MSRPNDIKPEFEATPGRRGITPGRRRVRGARLFPLFAGEGPRR